MGQENLEITAETLPGQLQFVVLSGQLDSHTFDQLQQLLADHFDRGRYRIILDLSGLTYISSAGAGVLIGALSQTEANDGRLVLMNVPAPILEVLQSLGLADMFKIAPEKASAMALCR